MYKVLKRTCCAIVLPVAVAVVVCLRSLIEWFSKRTGTSFQNGKARG